MSSTNSNLVQLFVKVVIFVVVASTLSITTFAHRRSLIPLYGSGPTAYLLNSTVLAAVLASSALPINISLKRNLLYAAIACSLAPNATYWIGVWTSRERWPLLGPAITHTTALGPLAFILTTFVVQSRGTTDVTIFFSSPKTRSDNFNLAQLE